ncbi:MAG: cyclic peptide export ABC transporter [Magnetococcales bacterium]|nr:cyclic peptide export ABC transporter [Magnetococcales bacterium]
MYLAQRLLEFIDKESERPKGKLIFLAVVSGISNCVLLGIINHSASLAIKGDLQLEPFLLYVVFLFLFIYTKNYALTQASIMVEEILRKVRVRIIEKIRHSELINIEKFGQSVLFNNLSQATILISQSSNMIFAAMGAGVMIFFAMFYIAWMTMNGFILTGVALGMGTWVFLSKRKSIIDDLEKAVQQETVFFETFTHSLQGFSEIKLNKLKGDDLFHHQKLIAYDVERYKRQAGVNSVFVFTFSQIFLYILIGSVIFIWPVLDSTPPEYTIKLTASILFIIGPIDMLVGSLPLFIKADVAVDNLRNLEEMLDKATKWSEPEGYVFNPHPTFDNIQLENVHFSYTDSDGVATFTVGPIDLNINKNEILFIVGGNGSGKSTILKLLTGLYHPLKGRILIDGKPLNENNYINYRELFSVIFTDFHLFDRFYGIKDIDKKYVQSLLKMMDIDKKTKYVDGAFVNLKLSTGQRKRLAYISALLDNKEIYIFDEWAADQDPNFRKYFYDVLLPELREKGKTIIAVTHDDKYFYAADRILKMDEGRFIDYEYHK